MLIVPVRDGPGRRLAMAIRDQAGRALLTAGTVLTMGQCEAIARRGYRHVAVRDGLADDAAPHDAISERTRTDAQRIARQALEGARTGRAVRTQDVVRAVDAIVGDLRGAGGAVVELSALRSATDYTYVHCVHVCVYALLIGHGLGLPEPHLRALGMGALLHDVGKVFCADLVAREGPLGPEDWARMRRHPRDGFDILRRHPDLHLYAAHVAFQHHERMDGSGYPRGLQGERILPLARMVAVADVYDAITADRPHAPARPPHAAVEELRAGAGTLFDPDCVAALTRRVALYPTGTPVCLADGSVGVVVEQGDLPEEPLVRLLGRAGRRVDDPEPATVAAAGPLAVAGVLRRWPEWLAAEVAV